MKISVVIPFYNEEDNIEFVIEEIFSVLGGLSVPFEIIAVNDGSVDRTGKILQNLAQDIEQLIIVRHMRNCGQGAAFLSGFSFATGNVIITMDGDGQNDFHDVLKMLSYLTECDAVFGERVVRKDPWLKRYISIIGNSVRSRFLGDGIRDTGCSLKVFKRGVIDCFIPFDHFFLFIPFFVKHAGFTYRTFPVNHRTRFRGTAKYSFLKHHYYFYIIDLIFMLWYKKTGVVAPFLTKKIKEASYEVFDKR